MNNRLNIFSPWMINLIHWGLIVLLLMILPTTLWPLTSRFWVSLLVWMICFTSTSFFCGWTSDPTHEEQSFTLNQTVYTILFILSMVLTPIFVYQTIQLVLDYGVDNYMTSARLVALDEDVQLGLASKCIILNQVLFVTTVLASRQVPWWQHVLIVLACASSGLAIMEKGTLIFMIIVAAMVYFMRGNIKIRHLLITGVVLIALSFVFTLARADMTEDMKSQSAFNEFVELYLLASPVAYCYMPEESNPQFGLNTFSELYSVVNKLGFGEISIKNKLQEFIEVPIGTNTYTVFQPFFLDFGQLGIAIFALIYGILFGLVYRYYQSGSSFAAIFYGYLAAMLCMQFHQEEIFSSIVRTLLFVILAFLLTYQPQTKQKS